MHTLSRQQQLACLHAAARAPRRSAAPRTNARCHASPLYRQEDKGQPGHPPPRARSSKRRANGVAVAAAPPPRQVERRPGQDARQGEAGDGTEPCSWCVPTLEPHRRSGTGSVARTPALRGCGACRGAAPQSACRPVRRASSRHSTMHDFERRAGAPLRSHWRRRFPWQPPGGLPDGARRPCACISRAAAGGAPRRSARGWLRAWPPCAVLTAARGARPHAVGAGHRHGQLLHRLAHERRAPPRQTQL